MRSTQLLILFALSYGLGAITLAKAQVSSSSQLQQLPEVKAWVVGEALKIDVTKPEMFRIAVQVPPDHHGYLDKGDEGLLIPFLITFIPLEERGAQVVTVSRPPGEWDETVHATVLRGEGEFTFRLEAKEAIVSAGDVLPATLRYQICNDVTNICYAPRTSEVPLHFADTVISKDGGVPSQLKLTISERIANLFQRYMRHLPVALGLVFIAGLIASATPCVYPIIPITSAILVARGGGSRQGARVHSAIYFLGIVFFYTLLGLFAAVTGTALSAVMTHAWVNLGFAVVFAYLGLSMLGFYEFHFLPSLTAKLDSASSHWGGFSGTFLMGTTAGLVVSPCVGPVVGAILLSITGQAAGTHTAGDTLTADVILRGIVLMMSFGVGLGVPFLIIGLLSNCLPQSGAWLTKVKFILGLPILYFAYTYYLKGMETAGVPENTAHAILVGLVAIGIAVFVGAFYQLGETPQPGMRLRRTLGIILLIIGTPFLYSGLRHSNIFIVSSARIPNEGFATTKLSSQSTAPNGTSPLRIESHGDLQWLRDFPLAQQHARLEQKPLFVDFYATWCANCQAFERLTGNNALLKSALQQVVLVKIYDTDEIFRTFQQDRRYPELQGVGGQPFLPLFAIYSPQGMLVWKGQDYKAVQTMVTQLAKARRIATP